jgi:pimeloyl-ACP methyl ester carboxylesterase
MDCESERTRQLDCWNGPAIVSRFLKQWASSEATPNFEPDDVYCDAVIGIGLNQVTPEVHEFWRKTIKSNYQGDEGRRRIRMAAINLGERGALHFRLSDIQCPVLWLHVSSHIIYTNWLNTDLLQGTKDAVYTIANAREEIQLFTRSPSATLVPVEGGAHFLNASHPGEVNAALLDFVNQHK